jgi:hypothetical protein
MVAQMIVHGDLEDLGVHGGTVGPQLIYKNIK